MIKSFSQIFRNQLIILFNLNVLFEFNFFMILIIFFFIMIVEQCINNKYVVSKMSFRWVESEIGKNSLIKNCVFFFKKCYQFFIKIVLRVFNQRGHFQQFIKNMIFNFDLFNQTSQFFLFAAFVSIVLWNF